MGRGRRNRLRGLLGTGAEDARAEPVAAVLCRAPLWWRARRGDANGAAAGLSGEGDHGDEAACQERPALSDRTLWHPGRRARGNGRKLREEVEGEATGGAFILRDARSALLWMRDGRTGRF